MNIGWSDFLYVSINCQTVFSHNRLNYYDYQMVCYNIVKSPIRVFHELVVYLLKIDNGIKE